MMIKFFTIINIFLVIGACQPIKIKNIYTPDLSEVQNDKYPNVDRFKVYFGSVDKPYSAELLQHKSFRKGITPGVIAIHGKSGLSEGFVDYLYKFASLGCSIIFMDLYKTAQASPESDIFQNISHQTRIRSAIIESYSFFYNKYGVKKISAISWGKGSDLVFWTHINFDSVYFRGIINFNGDPGLIKENISKFDNLMLSFFTEDNSFGTLDELKKMEESINTNSPSTVKFMYLPAVPHELLDPDFSEKSKYKTVIDKILDDSYQYLKYTFNK